MTKDAIADYDTVADNNTDVGGVDTDEGNLPSAVNNAIRELMSHLADYDLITPNSSDSSVTAILAMSQATYDGLTPDATTLYVIT